MISRVGLAISRVFEKTAPDPFVIAILLSLLTLGLALWFGEFPPADTNLLDRAEHLLDAWRNNKEGIWKLLEFSMQICLILVTGHALAMTRPVRHVINAAARLPRGTASAAALVSFVACLTAIINWGLGLIVGALMAREVGRSLDARGIRAHYPLIVASGYTGLMIWHGGLSGSAPLSMSTPEGAAKVLPASLLESLGQKSIGLDQTLFSPMNLVVTAGLLLLIPAVMSLLAPKREQDMRPACEVGLLPPPSVELPTQPAVKTIPDWLDRSPVLVWILAIALVAGLIRFSKAAGWATIGLNEINAAMLALGLVLHGSPRSYMLAAEEGAKACAGIIVQFPLYAGIMALLVSSGLVEKIVDLFTHWGNETTIPIYSFFSACIINMFIPSGGGQWSVQGPVAMRMAQEAGIEPGKMIMTVAYGDQITNMLQVFWATPLLAITGAKARDIVGYTAIVMVIGGVWAIAGLLIF